MSRLTNDSGICVDCDGIAHCKTDCFNKQMYDKLKYYEDLEEQERLIVLSIEDACPCAECNTGWANISSEGYHGCEETCVRLQVYNKRLKDSYGS